MKLPPPYTELLAETLISEAQLKQRIPELGEAISRDYAGKDADNDNHHHHLDEGKSSLGIVQGD